MRRILLLLLLCAAHAAAAQRVRGTVRENASRQPVPGTIVLTLDSARLVLARTITNARGEFDLPRPPQARTLRTLRLGFRPVETDIPASASPTVTIDASLSAIPVTLETVKTIAAAQCPKRGDTQAAFSLLEQVRTGLLATIIAREAHHAILTRLEVVRTRHFLTDSIMTMSVMMDSAQSTNSYAAALSAKDFIETGFAKDSSGAVTAYGPDAEVLMDAAFANGYCFRVMNSEASRPRQIGLGFTPANVQRNRVDIDGALWVDTSTKSLVDIVFAYRGFDKAFDRGRPGGHVEFRTMPNGGALIDRWFLRLPSTNSAVAEKGVSARGPTYRFDNVVMHETGGELANAQWDDGTRWRAALGSARLHLVDSRGNADTGRVVRLDSTTYVGRSDADGNVELTELTPGPYKPVLIDKRLIQLGIKIPTDIEFSVERDSTVTMKIATLTAEQFTKRGCAIDRNSTDGVSMLYGRILEPDGAPADKAEITIDRISARLTRLSERGRTGSNGLFRWCGLERGWSLVVGAKRGDLKHSAEVQNIPEGLTVVQFKLTPDP